MDEQIIPNSGDPRVDAALARIRGKFTDLEDAMVALAHLEKGITEQPKKHTRILEDREAWIAQQRERDRILDERIEKLLAALGVAHNINWPPLTSIVSPVT
jgi:hypothetical protein